MDQASLDFDDTQEGKIVTPLPPDQVHSTPGIVTPKPPFEFIRERNAQLKRLPDELLGNDNFLDE